MSRPESVHRPPQHIGVDRKLSGLRAYALHEVGGRQFRFAARLALGIESGAKERHGGDAWDLQGVLERQENAARGPLVRGEREKIGALELHFAGRYLVARLSGQYMGERRLAGAIRPHDGMHLAAFDDEIDTFEYFAVVDLDGEIFDFEQRHLNLSRIYCPVSPGVIARESGQ
jgi:hypothetical protein